MQPAAVAVFVEGTKTMKSSVDGNNDLPLQMDITELHHLLVWVWYDLQYYWFRFAVVRLC